MRLGVVVVEVAALDGLLVLALVEVGAGIVVGPIDGRGDVRPFPDAQEETTMAETAIQAAQLRGLRYVANGARVSILGLDISLDTTRMARHLRG